MLSGETIASLTSGRPKAGDGVHLLVMDLHKEINRLQGAIATMEVAGAKAYGLDENRPRRPHRLHDRASTGRRRSNSIIPGSTRRRRGRTGPC